MLRTPAHWSPVTFLEALTVANGTITTEAHIYDALHKAQGITHPTLNLETRIPHLVDVEIDHDFIYDLRGRVVSWMEYILNTNGISLVNVATSVNVRNDADLIAFLASLHRNINDRFNAHVTVWQKKAKVSERISNELYVAREVASQTQNRVDKAQVTLDRAKKSANPDVRRIEKAQAELIKASKAHELNQIRVNEIESQLHTVNVEFAEIRKDMVPLRKLEAISRYLNLDPQMPITEMNIIRMVQEIIVHYPGFFTAVLNIVDGRVIPQRY